jgi:HEPN domain-containing protein
MPPKTHDLLRLAEQAGVAHSEGHRRLLADLSNYYVETRYPEQVNRLAAELTRSLAEQCLTEAKEYLAWLDRQRR